MPDTKAIRARALRVQAGAEERQEWAKAAMVDVPALCDRVEALEAALRNARYVALVAVEGITRPKVNSSTNMATIAGRLNDGVIAIDLVLEGREA